MCCFWFYFLSNTELLKFVREKVDDATDGSVVAIDVRGFVEVDIDGI